MKIIMISGKSQSGKDTVASLIMDELVNNGYEKRVLIMHFADLVKYYAYQYFNWDGEKNVDGRALLQLIGTTIMRSRYPIYWAEIIGKFIDAITELNYFDYILIPDLRFINEYETVYDYASILNNKVITIRVERYKNDKPYINPQMTPDQQNHISECELDHFSFDWIIENRGDLSELEDSVKVILENIQNL